jgi:N-methylhydantoinase B
MLPGASGFGDPFARPPEKVLEDVEQGFVTRPAAASDYGVVITKDGAVDVEKTKRLRLSRVRDNLRADFDFGPEREAWEAVFDDETMCEINRRLSAMPKSVRHDRRRRIFESAVPNIPAAGLGLLTDVLRDPDTVRARLRQAMDELLI